MKSPVCNLAASERSKRENHYSIWRAVVFVSPLSSGYKRRKRAATSLTLISVVFWRCQHRTLFMLVLLWRLNSYWQLEASRNGELANIFLCHVVWSGTDPACSLSPKILPQVSYLARWWFHSDLSAAVDVWPIVLASVSKCFWQVSVKDRPQG